MLLKQTKTTTRPPWDPSPYEVTKVKGTQVTARRGSKQRIRNVEKWKVLKERPEEIMVKRKERQTNDTEESDDTDFDIEIEEKQQAVTPPQEVGGEQQEEEAEQEQDDGAAPRQSGPAQPQTEEEEASPGQVETQEEDPPGQEGEMVCQGGMAATCSGGGPGRGRRGSSTSSRRSRLRGRLCSSICL